MKIKDTISIFTSFTILLFEKPSSQCRSIEKFQFAFDNFTAQETKIFQLVAAITEKNENQLC